MSKSTVKWLAFLGLLLIIILCIISKKPRIENDLLLRSQEAVTRFDIQDQSINFNGRDATLEGVVSSEDIKEKIDSIFLDTLQNTSEEEEVSDDFLIKFINNIMTGYDNDGMPLSSFFKNEDNARSKKDFFNSPSNILSISFS